MTETEPVAPLVGAWIEILLAGHYEMAIMSLLSWERGLKYFYAFNSSLNNCVAPLVGAWIEMAQIGSKNQQTSRSSRGSVD